MSKKKSKKKGIHLEKEVRKFAKKRGLDEKNVLSMWEDVLEDETINEIDNKEERDSEYIKLLKIKIMEQQSSGRPTQEILGIILGVENERVWNVEVIKQLLEAHNKGATPMDEQNRKLVIVNAKGEPVVIAYAKGSGRPYPMRIRRERKMIFYGAPTIEDEDGNTLPPRLISLTIGGQIKIAGEQKYLVHQIDDFQRGKKVKMLVSISDSYVNLASRPITDNGYFDVTDESIDFDEIFDECSCPEEVNECTCIMNDYIEFEDIDKYVTDHSYTPFWSLGTVVDIGESGEYDSYRVTLMPKPSGSFDDEIGEHKSIFVPDDVKVNFAKNDDVRFVATGYQKKVDGSIRLNVCGIYPLNPVEQIASKRVKKRATKKKKTSGLDLFD